MYKEDLALNNLQWLIRHRTKPINQFFLINCLIKAKEPSLLFYLLITGGRRDG